MDIKEKIKKMPQGCGVYIMKNTDGSILYIGKAKSLKKRLNSYFAPKRALSPRLDILVSRVEDIDYIQTSSEAEALILESALIKSRQPKYNVAVKDDKMFPMLKVTVNEPWPRLLIVRRRKDDGARHFGPYTSARLLRKAVAFLRRVFPLWICKKFSKTPCLYHHLGMCLAHTDNLDKSKYDETVSELILFLEGKKDELIESLSKKMALESTRNNFEEAARLRDRIAALSSVMPITKTQDAKLQLEDLARSLGLIKIPSLLEAFDISNISGAEAVGSMVVFKNGLTFKSGYRRFKIKFIKKVDDYAMMAEVLQRRYKRLIEENQTRPDLIIIDGGKGHLSVACQKLKELNLQNISIIAIAKEFEHIYLPDKEQPIILSRDSEALRLIQRIRDEAHRFAISYHRSLREKILTLSVLDEIEGVGPKRKKALIRYFKSTQNIKNASLEELTKVKGIDRRTAKRVMEYFHAK